MLKHIYNYIYPIKKVDELIIIPDDYYIESDVDYLFVLNDNLLIIEKKNINTIIDIFQDLYNRIKNIGPSKITKCNEDYIKNLNLNKKIDTEEIFRLLKLYTNWVQKNSINTKILRQPSLKDGFNGCLFLYFSTNTFNINDNNFNNIEYANTIMNIITYINIITRYKEESMVPEINDIINSLNSLNVIN